MSDDKSFLENIIEKKIAYRSKMIASIAICLMGTAVMYITNGETGIGWAILGIIVVWG